MLLLSSHLYTSTRLHAVTFQKSALLNFFHLLIKFIAFSYIVYTVSHISSLFIFLVPDSFISLFSHFSFAPHCFS
jgi:hypothetical protein